MSSMDKSRLESLLWVSWRYHERRAQFLDAVHSGLTWASALASSGAFIGALQMGETGTSVKVLTALVAASQAFIVSFKVAERARVHFELRGEFAKLLAKLESSDGDEKAVRRLNAEKAELDAREPPMKATLLALCLNEYSNKIGARSHLLHIPGWWRFFANVFSHDVIYKYEKDVGRERPRQLPPPRDETPPPSSGEGGGERAPA